MDLYRGYNERSPEVYLPCTSTLVKAMFCLTSTVGQLQSSFGLTSIITAELIIPALKKYVLCE